MASELFEVCRMGRLNGIDAENPYMRSSNSARAWTAGVLMGNRGCVPTGCRPGRGHSLKIKAGTCEYKIDFAASETNPTVELLMSSEPEVRRSVGMSCG